MSNGRSTQYCNDNRNRRSLNPLWFLYPLEWLANWDARRHERRLQSQVNPPPSPDRVWSNQPGGYTEDRGNPQTNTKW